MVKLLAAARRTPVGVALRVRPALVPADNLLACVDGAMNGVMVCRDAAGLTLYYGAGAGSEQTASAVVADLVDIARLEGAAPGHAVAALGFHAQTLAAPDTVMPCGVSSEWMLRIPVRGDLPEAREQVLQQLARHGVAASRHSVWHGDAVTGTGCVAVLTTPLAPAQADAARRALQVLPQASGQVTALPVESLDQGPRGKPCGAQRLANQHGWAAQDRASFEIALQERAMSMNGTRRGLALQAGRHDFDSHTAGGRAAARLGAGRRYRHEPKGFG